MLGYQLLDSGDFRKYEQVGPYKIVRPAAQAVWRPRLSEWSKVDAEFSRFSGGNGEWKIKNKSLPKSWTIAAETHEFLIRLTDFGHLGIFPEQHTNWNRLHQLIKARRNNKEFKVLNLFAYTGGSTFAAATAGAEVVHVDASKTSVAWARDNATLSKLEKLPVRWIIDDVRKFVEREVRRKSQYHGFILDPPSYGRGTNNEIWDIEKHLPDLLDQLKKISAPDGTFILLSAHSNGYTPLALENLLREFFPKTALSSEEMLLREENAQRVLPSGASAFAVNENL